MKKAQRLLLIITCLAMMIILSSCDEEDDKDAQKVSSGTIVVENDLDNPEITIEIVHDPSGVSSSQDSSSSDTDDSEENSVPFDTENAYSFCDKPVCTFDKSSNKVKFDINFKEGVPDSDDGKIYLFEVATYESESALESKQPVASASKSGSMSLTFDYKEKYLFSRFVPAVLAAGDYIPLSEGQYITNPGSLAKVTKAYPSPASKKGILVDTTTVGSDNFKNLNVSRVIYNIPLSYIVGETTSNANPTVNFDYNGKTYHFNGQNLMLFDSLFTNLTNAGCHITAIILNDWNSAHPELIHPKSRAQTGKSLYYAFNTEEENGVRLLEATALFLAERYTKGDHGFVSDWVIGNEINQQKIWNYMACDDVDYYAESFERSFRIFYNAIRSKYSNARVYFSIDHDWNDNGGNNSSFFNARDVLSSFNKYAKKRGNYNWSLAIHPYPVPLPNTRFWEGTFDKSVDAKTLTPMNLSTLTGLMCRDEYLDSTGNVRHIAITELGFTSSPDEKLQAAAFAYCYYIVDRNKYISAFILNRQTDDPTEMKDGLATGVYKMDHSPKVITNIFSKIDTDAGSDFVPEMLGIIGASSLEEALEKAR